MPRAERAPSFQFYPSDWLSDPGVLGLSWGERGRYFWALCLSQNTPTPGDAAEDQWRVWMCYAKGEWARHRVAHLACFSENDGRWIQRRTVADAEQRSDRYFKANVGAAITNYNVHGVPIPPEIMARMSDAQRNALRTLSVPHSVRPAHAPSSASASALKSDSERKLKFVPRSRTEKAVAASEPESTPVARDLTPQGNGKPTAYDPHIEREKPLWDCPKCGKTYRSATFTITAGGLCQDCLNTERPIKALIDTEPREPAPEPLPHGPPESFRCRKCGTSAMRRLGEARDLCAKCWAASVVA